MMNDKKSVMLTSSGWSSGNKFAKDFIKFNQSSKVFENVVPKTPLEGIKTDIRHYGDIMEFSLIL